MIPGMRHIFIGALCLLLFARCSSGGKCVPGEPVPVSIWMFGYGGRWMRLMCRRVRSLLTLGRRIGRRSGRVLSRRRSPVLKENNIHAFTMPAGANQDAAYRFLPMYRNYKRPFRWTGQAELVSSSPLSCWDARLSVSTLLGLAGRMGERARFRWKGVGGRPSDKERLRIYPF